MPSQETLFLVVLGLGGFLTGWGLPTLFYARQRRRFTEMRRQRFDDYEMYYRVYSHGEKDSPMKRSLRLLEAALTPTQRRALRKDGAFEVVGSKSRKAYRIGTSLSMNINTKDHLFCAVPTDHYFLPIFDSMLAQKTLIELDEPAFLQIARSWRL